MRALVGAQRLPVFHGHVPGLAFRRARLVLDIGERGLVGCDQAGAGAAFDRHVADRHAPFHRQRADRLAGIFDDMTGAAGRADLADNGQNDVLGGDAVGQLPVDAHQHVLGLVLDQRLGGEHVLDLGGADAVRQRAEGAVGRGVTVAAHDRHAGQGETLFGADDVDDALAQIDLVVIIDAEIGGVLGQRLDLDAAFRIGDAVRAVGGRHVVIDDGERLFGMADLATGQSQALEGLRAGHLVNQMAVDIEKAGTVVLTVDQVVVEDFVVEGAWSGHCLASVDRGAGWACGAPVGRHSGEPGRLGAQDPREKARRQALSVLQRKALIGRIAEQFFHGVAHTSKDAGRQSGERNDAPARVRAELLPLDSGRHAVVPAAYRNNKIGILQARIISVVVEPIIIERMREWP